MTALVLSPPERTTPEACEAALTEALRGEAVSGLVAPSGRYVVALLPGFLDDELFELAERAVAGAGQAVGAPSGGRAPGARCRRAARARPTTRRAARSRRASWARSPTNGNGAHAPSVATYRDLGLLPAAALAAGLRRAAAVLRVAPGADRARRGPLRRRAHALARGLHRVQRPVGGGRATPVLPPSYAALSHPQDRGAHRARPELRARPHRVLAGAARARDRDPSPRRTARSTSEGWRPHRDQDRRVPRRADPVGRARAHRSRPRGRRAGGRRRGLGDHRRGLRRPGRADPARRRRGLRRGRPDRQGQGAPARRGRAPGAAPHALHLPAPGARSRADAGAWSRPARRRSPTRPSRTRAGGCRCWRR